MPESITHPLGDGPVAAELPDGVILRSLTPHRDARGHFTEVFRVEWGMIGDLVQWSASHSHGGVVRGVHVHPVHDDMLTVISGRVFAGLADLRPESPTHRAAVCLELTATTPSALMIPHGVAHGFYFPEPSTFVLGVTHTFDLADELGCRWDDPDLGIPWPMTGDDLVISPRDLELQPVSGLVGELAALAAS